MQMGEDGWNRGGHVGQYPQMMVCGKDQSVDNIEAYTGQVDVKIYLTGYGGTETTVCKGGLSQGSPVDSHMTVICSKAHHTVLVKLAR